MKTEQYTCYNKYGKNTLKSVDGWEINWGAIHAVNDAEHEILLSILVRHIPEPEQYYRIYWVHFWELYAWGAERFINTLTDMHMKWEITVKNRPPPATCLLYTSPSPRDRS